MASEGNVLINRTRRNVPENLYKELINDETSKEKKEKKGEKPERALTFQNIAWMMSALAIFYYTDFLFTVLNDSRIHRRWFNVGVLFIGINIGIALFMIVYLSYVKKINSDHWERHYPAAIPIATASFAFGSFCLTMGLWPVWSVFTPPILFFFFMAIVVVVTLLPNF